MLTFWWTKNLRSMSSAIEKVIVFGPKNVRLKQFCPSTATEQPYFIRTQKLVYYKMISQLQINNHNLSGTKEVPLGFVSNYIEQQFFFRIQCLKESYKQLQLDKISSRMCVKYKMYLKSN